MNAYLSTDICGPISPTSETGHRYNLRVFVCRSGVTRLVGRPDDSSGYIHTYFLKKKPDAPDVLNEFIDDIKQSGHRPENITIKSDAESMYIHGLSSSMEEGLVCRSPGLVCR